MPPTVLSIHLGSSRTDSDFTTTRLVSTPVLIMRRGCDGDPDRARALVRAHDGEVDVVALEDLPRSLRLAGVQLPYEPGEAIASLIRESTLVDGSGIAAAMERWAVHLINEHRPGTFSFKRVLMVPGLNHTGFPQAVQSYRAEVRYADPVMYFAIPAAGRSIGLDPTARVTLERLQDSPPRRLWPSAGEPKVARAEGPFHWADILAGDVGAIRRYAPRRLEDKLVAVHTLNDDAADFRARGVSRVLVLMPDLQAADGGASAATLEGVLAAARSDPEQPLTENTYLNLLADLQWQPRIISLLGPEEEPNRFAFVIHPLRAENIFRHPVLHYLRFLPTRLVEWGMAASPPILLSRMVNIRSTATGQAAEGLLISLGATPRELMRRDPGFTYRRLIRAAREAERFGAGIMGLGAFTSVVGDAGVTVAQKADVAITSGNSLTVAATLAAAERAVTWMGGDLEQGRAMVIGATGSIGSACSRILAQRAHEIVLVAPRPERLITLRRQIEAESPQANVYISTSPDDYLPATELVVTTTSAVGQKVIDLTLYQPGAVICDVARPPDVQPEDAALRPDVLVVESGEIVLPGDPDFGFDIGLPHGTAYACLAETIVLTLEGRYEDYSVGRNIEVDKVREIWDLARKHGLELAGLRSFGEYITEEGVARRRAMADALRADPQRLDHIRHRAERAQVLELVPPRSGERRVRSIAGAGLVMAAVAALGWLIKGKR